MNEQQQTSQSNVETLDQPLSVPSTPSAFDEELTILKTENQHLRHELRLRNARDELTKTLTSENARSPELLFEAAASRLLFDDDGKLNNLSEIIADIKTRFPEQFIIEKVDPQPQAVPGMAGFSSTSANGMVLPNPHSASSLMPEEGWPQAGVVGVRNRLSPSTPGQAESEFVRL